MSPASLDQLEKEIISCRKCPRLVAWREEVDRIKRKAFREEEYWARPVPGFGDSQAQVLVVGLAPGAHGSNRTGRMFTGDDSGNFLYPALWRAGFTNQQNGASVTDGLTLKNMWITAVCRCVPPDNKPNREEIKHCRIYLEEERKSLAALRGIVALGKIAWDEVTQHLGISGSGAFPLFKHGALWLPTKNGIWVLASYHPSRQNTQTGRLTAAMFDEIWEKANQLLLVG